MKTVFWQSKFQTVVVIGISPYLIKKAFYFTFPKEKPNSNQSKILDRKNGRKKIPKQVILEQGEYEEDRWIEAQLMHWRIKVCDWWLSLLTGSYKYVEEQKHHLIFFFYKFKRKEECFAHIHSIDW